MAVAVAIVVVLSFGVLIVQHHHFLCWSDIKCATDSCINE